jgi:hypothetical protein
MLWLVYLTDVEIVDRAGSDSWAFLRLQTLDDGILVGVTLLFGRLRFPGSWAGLGIRPVRPRWYAIGAAAGLAAAVLAWLVSVVIGGPRGTWEAPDPNIYIWGRGGRPGATCGIFFLANPGPCATKTRGSCGSRR